MSTYKIDGFQPIGDAASQLREYFPELAHMEAVDALRDAEELYYSHFERVDSRLTMAGNLRFIGIGWEFDHE
jgi:hypothetical protein